LLCHNNVINKKLFAGTDLQRLARIVCPGCGERVVGHSQCPNDKKNYPNRSGLNQVIIRTCCILRSVPWQRIGAGKSNRRHGNDDQEFNQMNAPQSPNITFCFWSHRVVTDAHNAITPYQRRASPTATGEAGAAQSTIPEFSAAAERKERAAVGAGACLGGSSTKTFTALSLPLTFAFKSV
jgi:hypothetical protein